MIGKLAKMVGYAKAPKATYMLRHPVRGTKTLLAAKGAKGLLTTRAGAALGALVAVPFTLVAMRGLRGRSRA